MITHIITLDDYEAANLRELLVAVTEYSPYNPLAPLHNGDWCWMVRSKLDALGPQHRPNATFTEQWTAVANKVKWLAVEEVGDE